MTNNCRVFTNLKTLEYDLALNGHNAKIMIDIILDIIPTDGPIKTELENYKVKLDNGNSNLSELKDIAFSILKCVECNWLGKGLFAQLLYEKIDENFYVPNYICEAIDFVLG